MKTSHLLAAILAFAAAAAPAMAACTMEDAMAKSDTVSTALLQKVSAKPDAVSKLMTEMGDIMGSGNVTAETCTKLDALAVRAGKI